MLKVAATVAIWQFLIELNLQLPYNPVIVLLGVYPPEMEIYTQKPEHKNSQ